MFSNKEEDSHGICLPPVYFIVLTRVCLNTSSAFSYEFKEETKALLDGLSKSTIEGGFWAYDYDSSKSKSEHSTENWKSDIVTSGVGTKNRGVKAIIWNDTPLRNYYNYVLS